MKNSTSKFFLCMVLLLSTFCCNPAAVKRTNTDPQEKGESNSVPSDAQPAVDNAEGDKTNAAKEPDKNAIVAFIREELLPHDEWQALAPEDRRYAAASWDLNADGSLEILFTIPTSDFCGSGGCDLWVLTEKGALRSKTTVVDFQIGISTEQTAGWLDLFAHSNGEDHVLRFEDAGYSSNASTVEIVSAIKRK